ncbi:Uncharacterised protein [Salmonella enterica subsp. enterica]|nr:Uncharacterised protein [Salmonella enterica subsp. enterica]
MASNTWQISDELWEKLHHCPRNTKNTIHWVRIASGLIIVPQCTPCSLCSEPVASGMP